MNRCYVFVSHDARSSFQQQHSNIKAKADSCTLHTKKLNVLSTKAMVFQTFEARGISWALAECFAHGDTWHVLGPFQGYAEQRHVLMSLLVRAANLAANACQLHSKLLEVLQTLSIGPPTDMQALELPPLAVGLLVSDLACQVSKTHRLVLQCRRPAQIKGTFMILKLCARIPREK